MQHQYHVDPEAISFPELLDYLDDLPRIRLWQSGKAPFAPSDPKAMTPEEYMQALLSGEIKAHEKAATVMSDEDAKAFAASLTHLQSAMVNSIPPKPK